MHKKKWLQVGRLIDDTLPIGVPECRGLIRIFPSLDAKTIAKALGKQDEDATRDEEW